MSGGFTFGQTPASTAVGTGGFSFGGTTTTTSTGPTFGGQPIAGGLSFGATPKATAAGFMSGGGTLAQALAQPTGGFNLGGTPATATPTVAFSLAVTPATPSGLTLGGSSVLGFGGVKTTTTASTGFSLGGLVTQATTGSGLGLAATTSTSTGLSFGSITSTSASTGLTGLNFGKTTASTLGTLGALPGTGLSLFTTSATPATLGAASITGSIFSTATTTSAPIGLGGVDPKTSITGTGTSGPSGKTSDGKALKETFIPNLLVETVETFQKYVKEEKTVREGIARMSTKPMLKVQEDVAALKQLLAVVSNGLQRNACAVEKLKHEMTQELKNAEMASRTKDIPPGLQYENTAPTEYFQHLVEEFEGRMLTYRQQIETLESHLASLHEPTRHSPAELIALMKKLHEAFIAVAAQLQQVNEAVKTQKEHYLNYRKIFYAETKNIFERQQKAVPRRPAVQYMAQAGPSAFTDVTSAAAAAMASVLTRSQQPSGAPPVAGLTSGTLGGNIGGLGTSGGMFGGSTFGGLTGGGLFNSSLQTGNTTSFGLTVSQSAPILGTTAFGIDTVDPNKPLQLQKPPTGAKRGKR